MRVHLHYRTTQRPWGGTNSFIRTLEGWLRDEGVDLTPRRAGADVFMINGAYRAPGRFVDRRVIESLRSNGRVFPFSAMLLGPRRRPGFVLRLDGLRDNYASGTGSVMDDLQLALLPLADRVVFQSRYALELFRAAGYAGEDYSIISNGVDGSVFKPEPRAPWRGERALRILASSWSENQGKGHATIASFSRLPNVEVRFVGRWPREEEPTDVRVEGPMPHADLAKAYRWADAFLFPARREACPNAVLEALASGLPVWYHPEGGTAEISAPYGVALTGDDAADLESLRSSYVDLFTRVHTDRLRFTIDRAGADYLAVFQEAYASR